VTAHAEIQDVLGRAAWGYDENDVDLLAAQFTEDAVMSMRIGRDGDLIGPFEGRAAIHGLHADALKTQTDQRRHNLSNLFLERETADEVTAISNLTLLSVSGGALTVLSSGWYRDQLVRRDGGWLIRDRYLYLDLPY
jgi:3-phenylpropionate/cinnamic acid dioxygenase small subunit